MIRFPRDFESDNPQYRWNELELVIRQLHQNSIGIGIREEGDDLYLLTGPEDSLNCIANGPADFNVPGIALHQDGLTLPLASRPFDTRTSKWIMLRQDGYHFYELPETLDLSVRPEYSQYFHGWYRSNGDRAIVFIDPDQPQGQRAIIMDSFNCHFEYEQRIPDWKPGDVPWVDNISLDSDLALNFTPGTYRIHLKAGKGGRGGDGGAESGGGGRVYAAYGLGGDGADGGELVTKLVIREMAPALAIRGSNGNNGGRGSAQFVSGNLPRVNASGGGGGASGSDTSIAFSNGLLLYVYGGAGGGGGGYSQGNGATQASPQWPTGNDYNNLYMSAGGGGGGGYGAGNSGSTTGPQTTGMYVIDGGTGGRINATTGLPQGGSGGSAKMFANNTKAGVVGQSHAEGLRRRDGGESPANGGRPAGAGGSGGNGQSDGYVTIYRIKSLVGLS